MDQFQRALAQIRMAYTATSVPVSHPEPILHEEMVPAGDGVELFVYYYLPAGEGVFPVLIQRHPYQQMDLINKISGEEFAKRGYVYVCQHCRGTGASKGMWEPNVNERADGLSLLDWVVAQPWCGSIGLMGDSYLSMVGWAVADAVPPQVKSMYLGNYGVDRFTSLYKDGMMRHDIMTSWAMDNAGVKIDADYMDSCRFRPHVEVDEQLWGCHLEWYRAYLRNPLRTDPYWSEGVWKTFSEIPAGIRIPLFVADNWYDHHLGSALYSFEHLAPVSRAHSTLCIGGVNHFGAPCLEDRQVQHAGLNGAQEQLDWFEATLKRGELPAPRIRTYLINADRWQDWASWPLQEEERLEWQFSAQRQGEGYALSSHPVAGEVVFAYDPENPVPSHGAEAMLHTKEAIGSLRQPEPGWRSDVLSFVSEPIDQDKEILGKIKLRLAVSTDAEDTAFTAKVMEVLPDGRAYNIRSTIATISAQHGGYTPGQVVELELEMWEIDWLFRAGSRLRVDISSSDFPQYTVHSNFAGPWWEQVKTKLAKQHIWCGEDRGCLVSVPVRSV